MAEKFTKMTKEEQDPIWVHPSVVENHKELGWQVAEEQEPAAEVKAKTEKPKGK